MLTPEDTYGPRDVEKAGLIYLANLFDYIHSILILNHHNIYSNNVLSIKNMYYMSDT